MRVERLVIEAGESTFTLDLHRRLTVVTGMGPVERASLIGEIAGALGGSRSGVHLELEARSGRHLAVFRPPGGHHRVVDVDEVRDITTDIAQGDGSCDLLAPLGLDPTTALRAMRFSSGDLATRSDRGKAVEVLAGLDQRRVWAAAEALRSAEGELASEALALGSDPETAALMDLVEARHDAAERATARFESTRKRTFLIGGASAVATLPGVYLADAAGFAFLAIGVLSVIASLVTRSQMLRAAEAEEQALADAGAQSYLGFQLQRVNGLIGDDTSRRALMSMAGNRRSALAEWQQLAGDIPVEWALANRDEIEAAAGLRRGTDALGALTTPPGHPEDDTSGLSHALITRLAEARALGGEGLPLLFDDAFHHLEPTVKLLLLELLGRAAGDPQIIFLTEDDDVTAWARLEAMAGDVALIEPIPEHDRVEDAAIRL